MKKLFATDSFPARIDGALLLVRLVVGLAFMTFGWGKIQNPFHWMGENSAFPAFLQGLAALSEFGGGLALITGLLTRLGCLGIAITMAVAVNVHVGKGDPFINMTGGGSYQTAAVYFTIAVLFVIAGPGRFSLDRKIFGNRS